MPIEATTIQTIDSTLLAVLQGIADKSLDSVKFAYTAGMFGNLSKGSGKDESKDEVTTDNNPYKAMCYMAVHCECPDILEFLFKEVVFKNKKSDDLLFQCMQAVVEQNNAGLDKVMLDCIIESFEGRSDRDTFAARAMREIVQEACIHENWNICKMVWDRRDEFPIPCQYDEKTKKNTGKDKEFIPAFITGAVFHDNLDAINMAVTLPDRWDEYTQQCLPTWFRMALEGHSRKVARFLLPRVKDYILTNHDYATCVIKDTMRTGAIELYVEICQMLLQHQRETS